jgi:molybdopterin synthase catalytic subunit
MSRVLLFASLREIAGSAQVESDAETVADLADELGARYGDRFARILARSSFVVGEERVDPSRSLSVDDEVAILPPVSGGNPPDGT